MSFTILKTLLLALAAGFSVQGFSMGGSMSASSSLSYGSSFSFESKSLMNEFSGFSGFSSLGVSTQRKICDAISRESASGTISFVDVIGSCGSVCIQSQETKSDLIAALLAIQQKASSVKVVVDVDYVSAFRRLDVTSVIAQNNADFFNNYGFCVNSIESILIQYLQSASSRSSITIDINLFRKVFGELFVKSTVLELQAIIRALFQQVGCYSTLVFTQPKYYEVNVPAFLAMQKNFAESIITKVQKTSETNPAAIIAVIDQAKSRYSGCQVCLSNADYLSSQLQSLDFSQSSALAVRSQISSAVSAFEKSSSYAFSSSSSRSSSLSYGASGCATCVSF